MDLVENHKDEFKDCLNRLESLKEWLDESEEKYRINCNPNYMEDEFTRILTYDYLTDSMLEIVVETLNHLELDVSRALEVVLAVTGYKC